MVYLLLILIGAVAGWFAGQVVRGNGFGLPGDVLFGVTGSFIGAFVFRGVGQDLAGSLAGILIAALAGALLLLFVVRLFTGRRDGRRMWS